MQNFQQGSRVPTPSDLLAVFDSVAKCAVDEYNGDGAVKPRIMIVTLDPAHEGSVASTYVVPEKITGYFFQNAQAQAHIGPFVDDLLFGHSEMRGHLLSNGVRPDLVVVVNESWMQSSTPQRDGSEVVLVTIHKKDQSVAGTCRIEEATRICSKGSLDFDTWLSLSTPVSASLH